MNGYKIWCNVTLGLLAVAVAALLVNSVALFWVARNQTAILQETYHSLTR